MSATAITDKTNDKSTDKKPNKSRLTFMLRYLIDNTDEDHPLSVYELIDAMKDNGYGAVTRKTATDDIQSLKDNGFSIYTDDSGTSNHYFYDGRPFQTAELKILLDAVDSAAFITPSMADDLYDKIMSLASTYGREKLQLEHNADPERMASSKILYVTDAIQEAIREGKKIKFQYADIDENKKRFLRHDGAYYVVSPYHTYQNDGRYYMLGFYDKRQAINTFRLELMEIPELLEEDMVPQPEDFDFTEYLRSTFKMYSGETKTVTLEADNAMMRKVIDKFGSDFEVHEVLGERFQTQVEVSVSETFFSWLFHYDGRINVIEPQDVCQQYEGMLERALAYRRKIREARGKE